MNTKTNFLSTPKIHPEFKLAGQNVESPEALVSFLSQEFPEHYAFLKDWFDEKEHIIAKTSGSTGKPKNIKISKKAMLASAEATGQFFKLGARSKVLLCLSSEFIAGKMQWVRALHLGWHLRLVPVDAQPLQHTRATFDFAAMVPLQAQNSLPKLTQISQLLIGGAPLSYALEQELQKLPIDIYHSFGMTETITHIALRNLKDTQGIYHCLPEIELSQNADNCMVIYAPRISKKVIITNDVVDLVSNTAFRWLGRFDHVINSGGYKIHPEALEKKLAPFITIPFFIYGKPDKTFGVVPVLIIETTVSPPQDYEAIFQKAGLHAYEKPKEVLFIAEFNRTPNGKVNRAATFFNVVG